MKYRPEIDGLRALAVIPVILFHAGFKIFSGGYIGVDVFFVISGYLITLILIENLQQDSFSIKTFYERRARRILPALIFVMLLCIPFAYHLMPQKEFQDFSRSLFATSIFASNLLFWMESGYFDTSSELKPLLHTWSLAVEEQFYIFFPIFLLLAWRYGKKWVFWSILFLAVLSLTLSEIGSHYFPSANFYLAPTRVWEIFIGSIAAILVLQRGVVANGFGATAGLVFILASIFIFDNKTPFPSLFTLLPVLGTFLIIVYSNHKTLVGKFLSMKVPVTIGLISYSAYLFHQPMFAFARIYWPKISMQTMGILSLLVFPLAYLSWKFIEKPIRSNHKIKPNWVLVLAGLSICLIIFVAFLLPKVHTKKWSNLQYSQIEINAKKDERFNFLRQICSKKGWEKCNQPEHGKINILSIGDSHEIDGYNSLYLALNNHLDEISFSSSNLGGCPPYLHINELVPATHPDLNKCLLLNKNRFNPEYLKSFDIVAVSAMYGWYNESHMLNYLQFLKKNYRGKVIVFGGTFGFNKALPDIFNSNPNIKYEGIEKFISYDPRIKESILERFATDNNFLFVSKVNSFCKLNHCQFQFNKELLTYDQHHLSIAAVQVFTNSNSQKIKDFLLN